MTIHSSDPFATPEDAKSSVRRFRARLPAAVTLWTAYGQDGRPAGLTVSSTLVADGDPGRVLGLLDDESPAWEAIAHSTHFAVMPLREADRQLADMFAGLLPAPGGPFRAAAWDETPYGPVLSGVTAWVGCRLRGQTPTGWALLVDGEVERVEINPSDGDGPLVYHRGRYWSGGLPPAHA